MRSVYRSSRSGRDRRQVFTISNWLWDTSLGLQDGTQETREVDPRVSRKPWGPECEVLGYRYGYQMALQELKQPPQAGTRGQEEEKEEAKEEEKEEEKEKEKEK